MVASMGVVVVGTGITFSRGAFFGFIVVNLLFLLWRRNANTMIFVGLLAAAALFGAAGRSLRSRHGRVRARTRRDQRRPHRVYLAAAVSGAAAQPGYGNGLGSILWSDAMRTDLTYPY